jgi:dihydrofolate reductase
MKITPIAACGLDMTIGKDGDLPWRLPADLRFFKRTTMGKPMIMGRRTFETLPGALKGRSNIVLTRQEDFAPEGVEVAHSVDEALALAGEEGSDEIMILGGATVYEELLPIADRLYLTVIHEHFDGDTFFPAFDIDDWEIAGAEHHEADAENPYMYSFFMLERVAEKPVLAVRQNAPGELPGVLRQREAAPGS